MRTTHVRAASGVAYDLAPLRAGSGISPIKALIESGALEAEKRGDVRLYYGTRDAGAAGAVWRGMRALCSDMTAGTCPVVCGAPWCLRSLSACIQQLALA